MDESDPQKSDCDPRWSEQLSGIPPKLLQCLMPFQREGVEFALSKNGRCMIADEMGLGKTVQAIAVACAYRAEWPLLVVVPSSLKYPWIEELERWIPELQPGDINLVESKSHTMDIRSSKVTVVGYGLLTTDARPLLEALRRQKFGVVVVDESHYLKSWNAARTKNLVPLIQSVKRAILLTGTPALGRPEELFMQIEALYPKRFGTWTDYSKKYCNAHFRFFGSRRQWDCRGASNLPELHQRLGQIMIRRLKAEVLSQLPPKIRQRIPFDLPKESAKEASAYFAEWERLMKRQRSQVAATENPFTEVMSLAAQMYKQTAIAKAGAVKDYIKMVLEAEQLKFLVFAHHLTMLKACTEAAIEAKAGYIRIDGSVPSSERIKLVHKFQSDPETRVAILSIQAAGQGLTFTAASHVVFAELYWNPGHMKQAEDRAHRIGQTSSVNVHYLIAKGTFDTVMWAMLNRKETVTGRTLNGRKEYLKADEGDKDKWEFLSFANPWMPSEMVLPLEGNAGNVNDDIFFSCEKEKQHDIRSFFLPSASKEKKRKKPDDEEPSPSSEPVEQVDSDPSPSCVNLNQDFSPQFKRLVKHKYQFRSGSRFAGKRSLTLGRNSPGSPASFVRQKPPETWSCATCSFSNSGLLPYCEMCEFPHSSELKTESPGPSQASTGQESVDLSSSDGKPEPPKVKQTLEEAEEEDKCWPEGKQSAREGGDNMAASGGCISSDHTHDCGAMSCSSSAADANGGDEGNDEGDAAAAQLVYPGLKFCVSPYTDRIYLYSKDGAPLNLSFIPLDIKLTNWDDLPEAFSRHRENRMQVLRFVQEWSGLAAMKQKLLRRSGFLFHSPTLGLQQLDAKRRPHSSTNRYLNREEVAQASLSKAREEGGGVRVVTKDNFFTKRRSGNSQTSAAAERLDQQSCKAEAEQPSLEPSFLQAVDSRPSLEPSFLQAVDSRPSSEPSFLQAVDSRPSSEPSFLQAVDSQPSLEPSFLQAVDSQPSLEPSFLQAVDSQPSSEPSFLQAVDSQGVPLCLSCQQACPTTGRAWDTRFCSHRCQEEFQLRSSQTFMRSCVLEAEQGVCQHCGLKAHELFLKVRDAPTSKRKEILENTWLAQLPPKRLNKMISAPVEGDFWQVDHIRPVYSGGGQCSMDNLQTLCTACHKARTAQQARERSQMKKNAASSKVASDIRFFFIRK